MGRRTIHIYLDSCVLDMTGLVVWITAGAGGNNADCGAVGGCRRPRPMWLVLGRQGNQVTVWFPWVEGSVSVSLVFHTEGPLL